MNLSIPMTILDDGDDDGYDGDDFEMVMMNG